METKDSWERSRQVVVPDPVRPTAARPGGLRVAFLIYRGNPRCGGQGVYTRHLTRELVALGHSVEVFAGPPWPELDEGVGFTPVPGLDLYRDPDPFRVPHPSEFGSREDWLEFVIMCSAGFGEPLAYSLRVRQILARRRADFDVVHDNQCLGNGMLGLVEDGWPLLTTLHHPITVDRELALVARDQSMATVHAAALVRVPRHAGPCGAGPARRGHGVAELQAGHRRADAGPSRAHDGGPGGSGSNGLPPHCRRDAGARTPHGHLEQRRSHERAGALARGGGQAAHRARRGPHRHRASFGGGRVDKAITRLGLGDVVHCVSGITDDELARLYGEAEVAVVPSLYEGFSLPAIEAMSCGVAVVATTGGALPEVVGRDGETGLLVPPDDPGALAGAIARLLDDPALRVRLGAAGRSRVVSTFTWEVTAAGTAACYRALLEGRPLPGSAGAPDGPAVLGAAPC